MEANSIRILFVDDSEDDVLLTLLELRHAYKNPTFARVETAERMQQELEANNWDLIIIDHCMPRFSSTEALELLNKLRLEIPTFIISGEIDEDIAAEAMRNGARDYLMKNNLKRLLPAVERELKEARDRKAHQLIETRLEQLKTCDALTGLLNRRSLEGHINKALKEVGQVDKSFVLITLDIDQFKRINDVCGHFAGDKLLQELAALLSHQLRETDHLARLGGDEFGLLLNSCSITDAKAIAQKMLLAVREFRFEHEAQFHHLSISIGLVEIHNPSWTVEDTLGHSLLACHAAKERGRNRIEIYNQNDPEISRLRGEMHWVPRLQQALEENRFLLYQQEIIHLQDPKTPPHQEILLRLLDEEGQLVYPDIFISAAERYNLMTSIDQWVIEHVLLHVQQQQQTQKDIGIFFINLSGCSLSDENFFSFVRNQLQQHQIQPYSVCFEITETAAISNLSQTTKLIEKLKEQHCYFALDDFGSGLSSFAYLKALPVDFLKIDGEFVKNIVSNQYDCAIVEAFQHISKTFGLKTIAEFVETAEVKEKLWDIGVHLAQGYGISRPRPLEPPQSPPPSSSPPL